jgi:hypothetical protein
MERALFVDDRGALRVTVHDDDDAIVLSIWRPRGRRSGPDGTQSRERPSDAAVCRATFKLTPEEADRLAKFLRDHLGATIA